MAKQITGTRVLRKPGTHAVRSTPFGPAAEETSVLNRAVEVIGNKNEAMRWMGTPVRALNYDTPVSLLGSRKGRESVLTVLERLEHGVL
jgi:putative toxin-antitoxin system antitoxin component (TIGR02293 family)